MAVRRSTAPTGDGKRPAKRRLAPRGGSPVPPKEGWALSEALKTVCGAEKYGLFEDAQNSLFQNRRNPPASPYLLNKYMTELLLADEQRAQLAAISKEIWSIFRPVAIEARLRAKAARGELGARPIDLDATIWRYLEVFDGEAMSLGDGVDGGTRFYNVTILPPEGHDRGGRPAAIRAEEIMDHLMMEHVGAAEFETAADLVTAIGKAHEAVTGENVAESTARAFAARVLPKLYARAKNRE